ncbi:hypothetical protein KDK95_30760 [Actinospica sp. MGRD01-02]|uniref:Uncharacterized protein n=1 Tax=Actinospica acidithermotolerans TaxID=2828514 RepID=A0A941EKF1_9ACTN|nr:hypothetical protein [Actinospica acidithermotolerans]MBR7830724.1 hypothetical protein [Actinospica acidithermotolerans]
MAERTRTLDELDFAVDGATGQSPCGTFRLQLFTATGARPVAIAAQRYTEKVSEGASLTSAAEIYVPAVWQRHFPDDSEPPIRIQLQLVDEAWSVDDDPNPLGDGFAAVTFTIDAERPYRLRAPKWERGQRQARRSVASVALTHLPHHDHGVLRSPSTPWTRDHLIL